MTWPCRAHIAGVSGGPGGCLGRRGRARRHVKLKLLCGLEVDNQNELDRGLDGELVRLRALEDAVSIDRRTPIIIG